MDTAEHKLPSQASQYRQSDSRRQHCKASTSSSKQREQAALDVSLDACSGAEAARLVETHG